MLAYFIIGIAFLIALIVGGNALASADPKKIIRGFRIAIAIVLACLAAFFVFTGRFQFAMPLAVVALFFIRNRPFFGTSNPSPGQMSDVKTDWLHASLDHDSGAMDAVILQGEYEGKYLTDLTYTELLSLREALAEDAQSVAILTTFLERNFTSDGQNDKQHEKHQDGTKEMSREEAYEILELQPGASPAEIKSAHRRLMKKFHPDHNGSAYMAAKINQAKEVLSKT